MYVSMAVIQDKNTIFIRNIDFIRGRSAEWHGFCRKTTTLLMRRASSNDAFSLECKLCTERQNFTNRVKSVDDDTKHFLSNLVHIFFSFFFCFSIITLLHIILHGLVAVVHSVRLPLRHHSFPHYFYVVLINYDERINDRVKSTRMYWRYLVFVCHRH